MKYTGIIFDLDGTLLDTLEDLADSMNAVLTGMNLPIHPLSDYRYHVGRGMRNLIANVLPSGLRNDTQIEKCFTAMFAEYGNRWDAKTRIYEGIPELLDSLAKNQIRMSIVSNKHHYFTVRVVEKFLSAWNFDAVFGERNGIPRKPDPVSLYEAAGIMGLHHGEIICLGDSGSDMTAAVNAGMLPVGALWGFRDADELRAHGASIILKNPPELLQVLDMQQGH